MGRKDPTAFKQRFEAYKNGKSVKEIYDAGYIKEPVITPDPQYNEYINSLPDNQRLTPESQYRSHRYWELNDKPKNFNEAIGKGMFTYDFTDNGWHARSVALNKKTGEYEFMKPNWHSTKMYEDAWYYSKDGADFRSEYTKKPGVAYDKYIPKFKDGKLPGYKDGKRYLWDDQTQSWDRITDSDVANAMAEWAFTPTTTRAKFDYENTPNPVKPLQKNAVISQDNNAWTKQRVAEESNKRTWLSDAADVSHAIGEGAMLASNFVPFEGQLVEGANWLGALAKSYIKHPNYITAYHGSPYPFDVKNAWTATWNDLGLHVGPKKTATTMAERGGVVYKLRIPKEDTQTIDVGQNGVKQLSDNFFMPAQSRQFPERYYDTTPGDDFRIQLLKEAGAEPYVKDAYKLYTENTVMLPLRSKVYPNIPEKYMRDVHELRRQALMNEDGITMRPIDRDLQIKLNQRANDILKDSGYKVIKYHNSNPFEGGGDAYMITDPSIIDVIPNTPKLKPLLWPTAVDAAYTLNK